MKHLSCHCAAEALSSIHTSSTGRLTIFGGISFIRLTSRRKHYVTLMLQECKVLIFLIFSCFISFVSNSAYIYSGLWEKKTCCKQCTNIYFDLGLQTPVYYFIKVFSLQFWDAIYSWSFLCASRIKYFQCTADVLDFFFQYFVCMTEYFKSSFSIEKSWTLCQCSAQLGWSLKERKYNVQFNKKIK